MYVNMNHAATSATKPKEVADALTGYLTENHHQSAGRGGELAAVQTALESRMALAGLFGVRNPTQVVFTSGATESLNMAINGLVRDGCHVLASSLEHNAVARPLHLLQQQGRISVTWLACQADGTLDPQTVRDALRPNTRLLVMTHASNVLGNVLPVRECFEIAKQHGLYTVLDAAQTAGHMPVVLDEWTDLIAFTGHKGLRGVAGSGGLVLREGLAGEMQLWKAGGTGSHSHSLDMPAVLPDRFEAGTPNMLGILGLQAAAVALQAAGVEEVQKHERAVTARFVEGLRQLPVVVYGKPDAENQLPVVSMNLAGMDAGALARQLQQGFEIDTRSGLHCSPLAHKTIGTFPQGALRFSFGAETTAQEIDYALDALQKISTGR